MKKCSKCKEVKQLREFHKDSGRTDGIDTTCKSCKKEKDRLKHLRLRETPEYREANKLRCKEWCDDMRNDPEYKEKESKRGKERQKDCPEKRSAYHRSVFHIKCPVGFERHHWSYKIENAIDVFILPLEIHREIHCYLVFDKKELCYRTTTGDLLDTRSKSEYYYNKLLKRVEK